jgi:hypothetical protein
VGLLRGQTVLVDTNVLIEAHRTGCLAALSNHFALHTVEKVLEETQTGAQNRMPEQTIALASLKYQLRHVAIITDVQRAEFALSNPGVELDPGERDLIIYAQSLCQQNIWFLNSPDVASVRYAHHRNWLDRLVSLEAMNALIRGRLLEIATRLQQSLDPVPALILNHDKFAAAIRQLSPKTSDVSVSFRIVPSVGALVLNDQNRAVVEFAHEVGEKLSCCFLKKERSVLLACQVAHPKLKLSLLRPFV